MAKALSSSRARKVLPEREAKITASTPSNGGQTRGVSPRNSAATLAIRTSENADSLSPRALASDDSLSAAPANWRGPAIPLGRPGPSISPMPHWPHRP